MNKDFIYTAIAGKRLNDAFNNIEFCYHIFNDKSPENISILETLDKAQEAIRTAKDKIQTLSKTIEVEKEIDGIMDKQNSVKIIQSELAKSITLKNRR